MKPLHATVTLPLLTTPESDFVREEIEARHRDMGLTFNMEIGAAKPIAVVHTAFGEPANEADRVALVIVRQQIEREIAVLIIETEQARKEQRAPVSPFDR